MTLGMTAELEAAAHRVSTWCGEPLLHEGEDAAMALAPGTVRREALEAAVEEMDRGLTEPSYGWRRDFALILGLERVLSEPQPKLASSTVLRRHQVDALAGQLAALIGDRERGDLAEDEEDEEDENGYENGNGDSEPELGASDPTLAHVPALQEVEPHADADDPGARRRYRFKHPTASGKTIAAGGFVEAARTTGVLILTHRRLLVDQFTRDLTKEGYGGRLHDAVLKGDTTPSVPPLTIQTYSWFIKHADQIKPDLYGVVVCDEAHTALGDKTAAAIRRLSEPVYIGMTATDQLLQKHVGDVFPAEVADFPLADAVRRGVVAPLRALRVKPGASLRNVPVVGGDYDQRALAEALDHEALNMAAAMLYRDRFDHRAGIVYAAGVDHAERVAAAMRATGLRARSVSGRTPPRALAATLAAYERGDINVLVNAQLLAEGWNAPRATVCMHLAPTASRR
ncbi:MAG: ribonuclease, partial [Gaiellales bacterium]|nr:ribonuclease [Gaiellales bacterium]